MAEISQQILDNFQSVAFQFSEDVDAFFQQRKGRHYLAWFNETLADKGPWKGVRLLDTPSNRVGFHQFWNNTPLLFGGPASLMQFTALMSIISNETRGNFTPITERMGMAGHPGVAYLFNAITGKKRSYNTLQGNRTALACFRDAVFLAAHGNLPLAGRLANTNDARWAGEVYPQQEFPTRAALQECGVIWETDFVKFRGRGLIQTTGRANYRPLIRFVQEYTGENSTIDFYRLRWQGRDLDEVATESTNDDWDRLFQNSDLEIACEAVHVHSERSGNYLNLSQTAAGLNAGHRVQGSLRYMGWRISGGEAYAQKFYERVVVLLAAI